MSPTIRDLTCRELVELVTAYLEQALSPSECDAFEAHLARCRGCRAYLDEATTAIRLAGRLGPEALRPETRAALEAEFRAWRETDAQD